MKVTTKMFYDRFLSGIQDNMEEILKRNEQLSSGKKINHPSDDPAAISMIVNYKAQLSLSEEYKRAIVTAKGPLESLDSSLTNIENTLQRAHELALGGASDTVGAQSRPMIAKEVATLLETVEGIANTKVGDRYIFSGYQSNTAPIDTTTGEFVGDSNKFEVDISLGVKVALNIPSNNLISFKRVKNTDPANTILPPYNYPFSANPVGAVPVAPDPGTPYDADPVSALYTQKPSPGGVPTAVANPNAANSGTTNVGTLTITAGDNDTSPVTLNVGAGLTLNQLRDFINTNASAKVNAAVVNFDTTGAAPDYRLVIASKSVGDSDKVKIDVSTTDPAGTGLNLLAYNPKGAQSMVLGGDRITNYNYITDTNNKNYYSFNNNYLNDNYALRALNFLKVSLENNDTGRIQKSLNYLSKVLDKAAQYSAEIGAGLNKIQMEEEYKNDRETEINGYLSVEQDTDIAQAYSSISQRQVALQSLKMTGADFLRSNLFDFLK